MEAAPAFSAGACPAETAPHGHFCRVAEEGMSTLMRT